MAARATGCAATGVGHGTVIDVVDQLADALEHETVDRAEQAMVGLDNLDQRIILARPTIPRSGQPQAPRSRRPVAAPTACGR